MQIDKLEWDHEVISEVLNDRDQELVWRIPLTTAGREDVWYWVKDSKGMFSVKSAYRHQQQAHGHINLNVSTDMWKRLWNLKVPPKVLNFLWRVSANCLPTRFLLALRHVQVDSLCPFCSAAPETALHVLVRCNFAKLCWQQAKVPIVAPSAMLFRSWFEEGLSKWNEVESIEAAMTLWALWKVRNDVVWNSISPSSEEVIHVAKMNYSDWCKAQQFLVPSPGTTTTELLRLASPGISDEQGPVVLPQNVLDLLLRLLVHVLLVESHQCLGDALTNGVDLRGVTSSLDTDPHVHAGETLSTQQ
ncbi:hypothetical protein G4B88_008366 [Cannabis sativa]|uniref:Reverse transcriptase zinc-binding domain-containing protein n=1 Tax=Cannabis sativa TaxID=3483 RepID=A0A7J6G7D0_CANSA|nr:hypothetical protein G4B88_008366 [Cannabis sativa]